MMGNFTHKFNNKLSVLPDVAVLSQIGYFLTRRARFCDQKEGKVCGDFISSDWNKKTISTCGSW